LERLRRSPDRSSQRRTRTARPAARTFRLMLHTARAYPSRACSIACSSASTLTDAEVSRAVGLSSQNVPCCALLVRQTTARCQRIILRAALYSSARFSGYLTACRSALEHAPRPLISAAKNQVALQRSCDPPSLAPSPARSVLGTSSGDAPVGLAIGGTRCLGVSDHGAGVRRRSGARMGMATGATRSDVPHLQ
jgi:hypothetical protein